MYHMVPPNSQPTWDSVMSIMSWKKRHNVRKIRMKSTHNIEPNELDGETSYLNYRDGTQSHKEQSSSLKNYNILSI